MDKQRQKPGETEQHLLDCALTLFAEKGYAATSVREIVEAAGITRPVLYYYCESKEGLFRRVVRATHENAHQGLAELVSGPATCAERLRAIIRGSFEFCAKDPRLPRIIYLAYYAPPAESAAPLVADHVRWRFGIIAQVMREGLASGELAGGDAESLALVFCALVDQHIMVLSQLPQPEQRLTPQLADALLDVFLNGVGTDESSAVGLPPFAAGPSAGPLVADANIWSATALGDLGAIQSHLAAGADIDGTFVEEGTPGSGGGPLHIAILADRMRAVRVLIEKGADPNVRATNRRENAPLHWAAAHGRAEAVELLVQHGADVNARDAAGETPLHYAAAFGRAETARILLQAGADPEARSDEGLTPSNHAAAPWELTHGIATLVGLGIDKDSVEAGRIEIRELLVQLR